jgi:hypothetical protein
MGSNGKPLPFQAPSAAGAHIVGQPFTVVSLGVPMNMNLTCNCGGPETAVAIVNSVPAACPGCGKVYNAIFNPQNGQIQMSVGVPGKETIPA